jgi:hypothetical protein
MMHMEKKVLKTKVKVAAGVMLTLEISTIFFHNFLVVVQEEEAVTNSSISISEEVEEDLAVNNSNKNLKKRNRNLKELMFLK